jgi:EAL domain-containing protein (putative c-di-GMP-specific phosphodiesterase class I)
VMLEQQNAQVDLLFCDLQMPDIDGVEFVRHLARLEYRGGLVLLSGEDERVLQGACTLAQAHRIRVLGAYRKPLAAEQLAHALATQASVASVERSRPARPELPAEELQQAITGGALFNHYQPKVELIGGKVIGVEALVRCLHPRLGLVMPDQFIAVAESHNLIDALTDAVLTSALAQSGAWRQQGFHLAIAINVSMDNLRDLCFPDRLEAAVVNAGFAARDLTLEVTESRLMQNPLATLDILSRLRLKGFGLAIDDFGTGHSSLAQLRDLPFQELKLDRSFVHGANRDPARRAIVEATLALAHQLGMKAVAEGVEDRADWDFLATIGCDIVQGYLVARPMTGAELPSWCATWTARHGLVLEAG